MTRNKSFLANSSFSSIFISALSERCLLVALLVCFLFSERLNGQGGGAGAITIAGGPRDLDALCATALVVTEVTVESTFLTTKDNGLFEADALLQVNRSYKADVKAPRLVISQQLGPEPDSRVVRQYPVMKPGEHYIVFLTKLIGGPARVDRGVPRYQIVGEFVGLVQLLDGKTRWSSGMPPSWRNRFDGAFHARDRFDAQGHTPAD